MNISNQMFIMSAWHKGADPYTSHLDLGDELTRRGYSWRGALGCYKGEKEFSYVVSKKLGSLNEMLELAREFKQESILYIDANRGAHLYYTEKEAGESDLFDGDYEYLGRFTAVEEKEALAQDGYTRVNGEYYTVF